MHELLAQFRNHSIGYGICILRKSKILDELLIFVTSIYGRQHVLTFLQIFVLIDEQRVTLKAEVDPSLIDRNKEEFIRLETTRLIILIGLFVFARDKSIIPCPYLVLVSCFHSNVNSRSLRKRKISRNPYMNNPTISPFGTSFLPPWFLSFLLRLRRFCTFHSFDLNCVFYMIWSVDSFMKQRRFDTCLD